MRFILFFLVLMAFSLPAFSDEMRVPDDWMFVPSFWDWQFQEEAEEEEEYPARIVLYNGEVKKILDDGQIQQIIY